MNHLNALLQLCVGSWNHGPQVYGDCLVGSCERASQVRLVSFHYACLMFARDAPRLLCKLQLHSPLIRSVAEPVLVQTQLCPPL